MQIIRCPSCRREVYYASNCSYCGYVINEEIEEHRTIVPSEQTKQVPIKKQKAVYVVRQSVSPTSSCLSGLLAGSGCVVGVILTLLLGILLILRACIG